MLTQTISSQVVVNPSRILQTSYAFWSSKVLLTAANLDLFTHLSSSGKTAQEIKTLLGLKERGLYDFLDTLVALKFLYREGSGANAKYNNALEADIFLDRKKPSYIGGALRMANNLLFPSWNRLEEALVTGLPQSVAREGDERIFDVLYSDEKRLEEFLSGMSGVHAANFTAFATQFDFSGYRTHCDIGGAGADLSIQIATHHPGLQSSSFDLPQAAAVAKRNIDEKKVSDRVKVVSGNFFTDEFPKVDVITMASILHDWSLEEKKLLIKKAYDALPAGGALVAIENIIDDERKENVFGLLMSLNMLIQTYGGFDFTASDFTGWVREAGFNKVNIMHLAGSCSALIAYK